MPKFGFSSALSVRFHALAIGCLRGPNIKDTCAEVFVGKRRTDRVYHSALNSHRADDILPGELSSRKIDSRSSLQCLSLRSTVICIPPFAICSYLCNVISFEFSSPYHGTNQPKI